MSQLFRVNQDPDEISGLLGVIEMKGFNKAIYNFKSLRALTENTNLILHAIKNIHQMIR
jgi:hypothetical protein